MLRRIILATILFGAAHPVAAQEPLVVGQSYSHGTLGGHLAQLEDKTKSLTLVDALGPQAEAFKAIETATPSFGFTRSAYWFRFVITNKDLSEGKLLIELSHPVLDNVTLYTMMPDGSHLKSEAGDHLPFAHREVNYRNFVFKVQIPEGDSRTYFLRVESESSVSIPLAVWTHDAFEDHRSAEQITLGLYYGAIIALLLYNAFLFVSTREPSYFFYVGFMANFAGGVLASNGLSFQYLWPNSIYLPTVAPGLFGSLALGFTCLFTRVFLGVRARRIGRVLLGVAILDYGVAASSLVLPASLSFPMTVGVGLVTCIAMLFVSISQLLAGNRSAVFFCAAWTTLITGSMAYFMNRMGLISANFLTTNGMQLGSAVEALVLSLGIGDRYNTLKREQVRSQLKIIDGLKTIEHLKNQLETLLDATKDMTASSNSFAAVRVAAAYALESVPSFERANIELHFAPKPDATRGDAMLGRTAQLMKAGKLVESTTFNAIDEQAYHAQLGTVTRKTTFNRATQTLDVPLTWGDTAVGYLRATDVDATVFDDAEEHFVSMLASSMSLAVINLDSQGNLQGLVERRTVELQVALSLVTGKAKKIQKILDHIKQGILTFDGSLAIDPEFSRSIGEIYRRDINDVPNCDVLDLVLEHADLTGDERDQIRSFLAGCTGEPMVYWEINCNVLPSELTFSFGDERRILAIEWIPIATHDGYLERVMLTIRDLTEQRALEAEVTSAKRNNLRLMDTIGDLIRHGHGTVARFLKEATSRLESLMDDVKRRQSSSKLARDLHTIKGLSRMLGFRALTENVHHAETVLAEINRSEATWDQFDPCIDAVQAELENYQKVFSTYMSGSVSSEADGAAKDTWSLAHFTGVMLPMVKSTLADASLSLAGFTCDDTVLSWNADASTSLGQMLTHALNNAIDHGYILPVRRGTVLDGARLTIRARHSDNDVIVEVIDRGAGLDMERLRQMSGGQGDPTEVLFADGVSTASEVTLTSGRGVGLSAVRHEARRIGGDVSIRNNTDGGGTVLTIRLPANVATDAHEKAAA